jgi:hypothetical protein
MKKMPRLKGSYDEIKDLFPVGSCICGLHYHLLLLEAKKKTRPLNRWRIHLDDALLQHSVSN